MPYSRQIALPDVGSTGQERLANATAYIETGDSAIDASVAYLLAAAGVTSFAWALAGTVTASTIQRSIVFEEEHLGQNINDVLRQCIQNIQPTATFHASLGKNDCPSCDEADPLINAAKRAFVLAHQITQS